MRAKIGGSERGCSRPAFHSVSTIEHWSLANSPARLAQPQGKIFPIIGQVRRIIRIAEQRRAPAPLHGGVFLGEAFGLRGREIAAATDGFMMDQLGERGPQIEIPSRADSEAEIDIIECDRQVLIEAADAIEYLFADHQACGRDGTDILYRPEAVEVAGIVGTREAMAVPCDPAEADHHAG